MCITGKTPDEAIKNIAKKMNTSKNNAARLVMTESAYFSSASQKDAFKELCVERFEVIETLDGDTCPDCGGMDGRVVDMKDFEAGITAPPFHPFCRGCTAPYYEDNIGERAARDEDGKTYYIPSSMGYPEWKETFADGGTKIGLKAADGSAIINKRMFNPAATIDEAEEFARKSLEIPNVSYKGVDIITANAWNEGLNDAFDRFPELRNNFGFVGEAHERNTALKPVIKQHYLDELMKKYPSYTQEQLEPYAEKSVKDIIRKLKVSRDTFAQSWSPSNAPFSDFRGVTVNRDWGKDSSNFVEALASNVKSQFHPIGCGTIRSVLDHEIGHQLDDMLGISRLFDVQKLFDSRTHDEITNAISRYSWENNNPNKYGEMIAEAWAEYGNNPKPREIASRIGKIIEEEYKKKYGMH